MDTMTDENKKTRRSYPYAVRRQVIELYEQGLGSKRISRKMEMDDSMIRRWIRKYKTHGDDSLHPYKRIPGAGSTNRHARREQNEGAFRRAFEVYSTTLEPVASITRRHGLDYNSFRYHVERYHPELVSTRNQLRNKVNN